MNVKLGYMIDKNIRNKYSTHIANKYGYKRNKCGSEITKLMKLELMLEGDESYRDDPDVNAMVNKIVEKFDHTHTMFAVKESVGQVMEEKINRIVEEIVNEKVEEKLKKASAKKVGSMATFKKNFQLQYGSYKQVSRRDIVRFVMNNDGVYDSRAIQNRIDYLLATNTIEPFAQNVYNIKL